MVYVGVALTVVFIGIIGLAVVAIAMAGHDMEDW